MRCPDFKYKRPHKRHWHTVYAGTIVVARGECPGYNEIHCGDETCDDDHG